LEDDPVFQYLDTVVNYLSNLCEAFLLS